LCIAFGSNVLPGRYGSPRLLASGGMGEVYLATDSVLERKVAVKLLAERFARDEEIRRRFTREALAAARLSGEPHVVTIYDVGEHDGRPFIVMEYLSGGSLHERVRKAPVSPARALDWLGQAAVALDAAHRHGIVHRDVKPANLLFDHADSVHVTDFGIATAVGFDTFTSPGTILGTAGYLSPEQARGEPATPASDRYALGVVAFELLTGRRPFAADTPTAEAFGHASAPPPSAASLDPELPRELDAVFERALAKLPARRHGSSSELVAELRAAFRSAAPATAVAPPVTAATSVRATPVAIQRRRRLLPLFAGALVLLLGGAGLAFALARDGDEPRVITREVVRTQTVQGAPVTVTEATTVTADSPTAENPAPLDGRSGEELNEAGFERMQAGDFATALPLLEQAVSQLQGTGSLAEAYASYNLAFTRFALGSCDGVLDLLDRSEQVQGERREIDRLRRQVERACGDGGDD
jgi:eukaryotic-like serine/threonine-protein kinase